MIIQALHISFSSLFLKPYNFGFPSQISIESAKTSAVWKYIY